MYPGVKLGIGPAIDNGFYYDVDFGEQQFSSNDFEKVEQKIFRISRINLHLRKRRVFYYYDLIPFSFYIFSHNLTISLISNRYWKSDG